MPADTGADAEAKAARKQTSYAYAVLFEDVMGKHI
jgi:hypothetical protein